MFSGKIQTYFHQSVNLRGYECISSWRRKFGFNKHMCLFGITENECTELETIFTSRIYQNSPDILLIGHLLPSEVIKKSGSKPSLFALIQNRIWLFSMHSRKNYAQTIEKQKNREFPDALRMLNVLFTLNYSREYKINEYMRTSWNDMLIGKIDWLILLNKCILHY